MTELTKPISPAGQSVGRGKPAEDKQATTKALDIIIIGCISAIFFLCPLFFTGLASQGVGFEKMILFYFLVLIGIVAWVTKGVVKGELGIKRTPLDWPILGLLAIFIISTFFSVNAKDSLIGSYGALTKSLAAVITFALFYYLVVNNINIKRIKILFWSFIASISLIIIYSLLQLLNVFVLPLDFSRTAGFNPLGSLSGLTIFLVAVLPLLVIAAAQLRELHPKLNRIAYLIIKSIIGLVGLAALMILALLNGFTFWPAAIAGIAIILMFFLAKIIPIKSGNLVIPLATFLLLIILLVLGNFNMMNLNLPAEVSLSRGISWDIAKASLAKNPILGSGPATFYYDFSQFRGADFNASSLWNTRFNSPSGILFEAIATVGSLGTLALLVIILITLSICFITLIKTSIKETHSIILALFSSYIIIIVFAGLFALNNAVLLFALLIAVLTVSTAVVLYPERFKVIKLSFRASPKYALALAAIFLCVSAGVVVLFTMGLKMYLSDIYVRRALAATEVEQKITALNKAISLFPYEDSYYLELANQYMAQANQEAVGSQNQTVIENSLSQAIETGRKALEISPNKAANNEALALIYENASFYTRGALEWAENLYNDLIKLEPDNPLPHLRLALINMARANAEEDQTEQAYYINEAIKKYDEALAKKDNFDAAYYGKAIAEERLGDIDGAIDQLQRAVILNRNNVDYRFELGRLYFNRAVTQPNLAQNATEELTTGEEGNDLSVEANQGVGGAVSRNDDLDMAEQIFLSILQLNPNHANALYSLGLIYQQLGETDNAKIVIGELLKLIPADQAEQVKAQFPGLY